MKIIMSSFSSKSYTQQKVRTSNIGIFFYENRKNNIYIGGVVWKPTSQVGLNSIFLDKILNSNNIYSKRQCHDELGFTLVDLNKVPYMDEPFIMAQQVRHVFYVQDPCDSRYSVVLWGRPSGLNDAHNGSTLDICEIPSFSTRIPSIIESHYVDDVHANRNDHDEGLWENIVT